MTKLDDALIDQLAHQESPRAYSHEVKYMAQEILEYRTKATEAAKGVVTQNGAGQPAAQNPNPYPWPYGGAP